MVSIDMCKHKAGYRLYHKTNAFADLESWADGVVPFTMIIYIRLYQEYGLNCKRIYTGSTLGLTTVIMILLLPYPILIYIFMANM